MQQDKQIVELKLWVDSDPYRLIQNVQMLDPKDVDEYIAGLAKKLAENAAIKEVQAIPGRGTSYDNTARQRRVKTSTEHRLPGFLQKLSKYKIRVTREEALGDGVVMITGERL